MTTTEHSTRPLLATSLLVTSITLLYIGMMTLPAHLVEALKFSLVFGALSSVIMAGWLSIYHDGPTITHKVMNGMTNMAITMTFLRYLFSPNTYPLHGFMFAQTVGFQTVTMLVVSTALMTLFVLIDPKSEHN